MCLPKAQLCADSRIINGLPVLLLRRFRIRSCLASSRILIPSETRTALFLRESKQLNRSTSFRFFLSDENRKEKDRNPRVNAVVSVTLWIPVFFGQEHTITEVLYTDTVLYQQ